MSVEDYYNTIQKWKAAVDSINGSILPQCNMPTYKEFESYGCGIDLRENMRKFNEINSLNQKYLRKNELPSINMGLYPLVGLIIGPTGSGKSQFLRNLLGYKKLQPPPEYVIFITPTKGMLSQDEITLWKTQLQEGNYSMSEDIYPTTNVFKIEFLEYAFDEIITQDNLNSNNENSIFYICARKGPTCVILDECMQKLIQKTNISPLYCSLPSKLSSKFGNAFYMFVVLHNVNPTSGNGNNIMDLKAQAKLHILSTKNQPMQLAKFVHNRSGGMNNMARTILMNSIVSEKNTNYSFILYNTSPLRESFQWCCINDGGKSILPLCMDLQTLLLNSLLSICNVCIQKIKNKNRYEKDKKRKLDQEYQ